MNKYFIVIFIFIFTACSPLPLDTEMTSSFTSPTIPVSPTVTFSSSLPASPPPTNVPTHDSTPTGIQRAAWPTQTSLPPIQPAQPLVLTQIQMNNENIGWSMTTTGHRLRTEDGGYTWKDVTAPEIGFFSAADDLHAREIILTWVSCKLIGCTGDRVPGLAAWRTMDGGQTWQRGTFFSGGMLDFRPIVMQFIDDKTGWFLLVDQVGMSGFTYESLFQTPDGGDSWKLIQPFSNGCISGGMIFTSPLNGWIGRDCSGLSNTMTGTRLGDFLKGEETPLLAKTMDGGLTWTDITLPPPTVFPRNLTSDTMDPNISFYCGIKQMDLISEKAFTLQWVCKTSTSHPSDIASYAYLTNDDGQTWRTWLSAGKENFITPDTGWRMLVPSDGQHHLLQQTTDGGITWNSIKVVNWQTAHFDFVDEQIGWALVSDGVDTSLVHTVDGGKTWEEIKPVVAQ